MTVQYYPNGIGGTAPGDSLDLARPLQTTGNVWYVSSLIGTDAAAPAGQNREKPLATLAQAQTNASAGDIVVFLAGHAETLTAQKSLTKGLTFIGEGTTGGMPAVSFTMNAAAASMFSLSTILSAGTEFRNIYFPPNAQANSADKVLVTSAATDTVFRGCYFACGATDLGAAVSIGTDRCRMESCTFISTATLTSAQPLMAIRAAAGVVLIGLTLKDTVVSAGTVGFSNYSAVDFSAAAGITQLKMEGVSLLLGADMNLGAGTVFGRVNVQLATGGSRVAWS